MGGVGVGEGVKNKMDKKTCPKNISYFLCFDEMLR